MNKIEYTLKSSIIIQSLVVVYRSYQQIKIFIFKVNRNRVAQSTMYELLKFMFII